MNRMLTHFHRPLYVLSATILILFSPLTFASDLQKEIRMKQEIIDYIMDGEAIMLNDAVAQHDFLTIYTESTMNTPKGVAIIVHGRGHHPNWAEVVHPLRTGLPEFGWHTLSIQAPVLGNDSSFYDYLYILQETDPRIESAIAFLQQKSIKNIVLIAHSCSVHMAFNWLHKNPNAGINAFIGIGMGSTDIGQPMLEPFPLQDIKMPVLDIRGEYDYPAVIAKAPKRLKRIQQAGNPKSDQRVVAESDHYYTARGDALLTEIADWLNTL